ncbi:MAG: glycosyltransferase family 4 protein [Myxococcota bacterium]|nr:glycosyltransferase family 4 protein [Myxococcota bacterium]
MRILFALPGLHRVHRGAEVAFESIAQAMSLGGQDEIVLAGSGHAREDRAYGFWHVPCVPRERFERLPKLPFLRHEYMYEELTFASGLAFKRLGDFDLTVTCSYPYVNWALRRPLGRKRIPHVFVTQNGDWPATSDDAEYRFFSCDGLVCTNPEYFERNRSRWRSTLIPNGVDPDRFSPGPGRREALGLPEDRPVILMVSALAESKRVLESIRAVSLVEDAFLVVAGDGPLRSQVDQLASELLPGRFMRGSFAHQDMPDLYRSADVFLHSTPNEAFGNVYVEALASGLPVVANDEAHTHWILGDWGDWVDVTSPESVAGGIRAALSRGDRKTQERAGFAAERYAWTRLATRYRAFFDEVLDRTDLP